MPQLQRVLSPVVEVRKEECAGVMLMFAYSFLAMTAYNILKPVTRSKFISALGADNLPYVLLAAGLMIGVLMTGYSWLVARLPRTGALPITQAGMAALVLVFWGLFQTETRWASPAFYLMGLILGVLLISQFWTVANLVYDPRQAKRVFGFIGGGASLGGIAGSYILRAWTPRIGTTNMLLISSVMLLACAALVWHILHKANATTVAPVAEQNDEGVSSAEGYALLRSSSHLKIIALVISFAAVGAAIIEQQLNMAAEAAKGADQTDAITVFLAQVQLWTSTIGFVIQIWLTSRIHRYLGIGFALMVLPVSLGAGAIITLLNAALWAPGLARVFDQSLRYTVDKTTREILFLPLPGDVTLKAKSFVDVTVDRMAKAFGALLLLVLVQPWGLNLDWQQLSYASLTVMGLWFFMSVTARRGYLDAFRQSIGRRDIDPAHVRLTGADLSTVETLVHELASPNLARVLYAIDMLQALGKGDLVTPLLLRHESPQVRERSLRVIGATRHEDAAAWTPQVRHALADPDVSVRAAALVALGALSHEDAASLARPLLTDLDPRIRATAAVALASSSDPVDLDAAEATLSTIVSDSDPATQSARHDVAAALAHTGDARFRRLLVVLLYDPARKVADRAMSTVRTLGNADFIFVPTLVSLLRNRQLKGRARDALVSYGESVIDSLAYFMADPHEDEWVRRHLPGTLAAIPSQSSVDVLIGHLNDPDRFVRYKVVQALTRLRRADDRLRFPADVLARKVIEECRQFFRYLSLHGNLSSGGVLPDDTLLAMALEQKRSRGRQRIFYLLGLTYAAEDIAAAEWTLTHGEPRTRASASEYLDNLLTGQVRKMVLPVVEDLPADERVGRGNVLIGSRRRDVEETLLHLINDEDQVISACAIEWVRQQRRWNLAPDIEHLLAHREARDWFVFEAASLALAEHRLQPDRRRRAWLEPLPAVALASQLRMLPLFASLSVDELMRMAGASRQIRHEPGTVLLTERAVPEMFHVLLDGEVTATGSDAGPQTVAAPAALGFTEALLSRPMPRTIRASNVAVTLAMSSEQLLTQLAYNSGLVRGLFATLSPQHPEAERSRSRTTGAIRTLDPLADAAVVGSHKALALQQVPLFSHLSPEEALQLAGIAQAVTINEGQALLRGTGRAAVWVILSGEVQLEGTEGGAATRAVGGDTVGAFTVLAGPGVGGDATVLCSGVALRIERDDLFDMLADRPEMLRQLCVSVAEWEHTVVTQ